MRVIGQEIGLAVILIAVEVVTVGEITVMGIGMVGIGVLATTDLGVVVVIITITDQMIMNIGTIG
jgi:hypothetical protein